MYRICSISKDKDEKGKLLKPGHSVESYQSSLKLLLAGFSIKMAINGCSSITHCNLDMRFCFSEAVVRCDDKPWGTDA